MFDILFSLVLTFGAFQLGLWCQKKLKSPLCNPVLIATILIIGFLLLTGYPNETYQSGTSTFQWLLTPATVCLALPLYRQLKILGKNLWAILSGIAAWYAPEDLEGKKVIIVDNLKPAKLCGELSEGMILAGDNADGNVKVLFADDLDVGAKIH